MAQWNDFERLLGPFGGKKLSDDVFMLTFEVEGAGSKLQELYLTRETIEPGFDVVKANCAISLFASTDISLLFRMFGDVNIGSLQFIRSEPAMVSLGTSLPLPIVDMSEPGTTMAVLHSIASASRKIARQVGGFV